MVSRMFAVGCIATLGLAVMLVPNETFGRSGGGFSGRSYSKSSGSHPSTMRPLNHATAPSLLHQHQRNAGWLLPFVPRFNSYGTYYAPSDYGTYYAPSDNAPSDAEQYTSVYINPNSTVSVAGPETAVTGSIPEPVKLIVIYRPSCGTETVTVPWDDGKELTVNIVRC